MQPNPPIAAWCNDKYPGTGSLPSFGNTWTLFFPKNFNQKVNDNIFDPVLDNDKYFSIRGRIRFLFE